MNYWQGVKLVLATILLSGVTLTPIVIFLGKWLGQVMV